MSIEDEARDEAKKRYSSRLIEDYDGDYYGEDEYDATARQAFVAGVEWHASRQETDEREALRGALVNVLCNAGNFPEKAQARILGQDMNPLIEKTVEAVVASGFRPQVADESTPTTEASDWEPESSISELIAEARANVERVALAVPDKHAERIRRGEVADDRLRLLVKLADALEKVTAERDGLDGCPGISEDA